jgi:hypothetical protein
VTDWAELETEVKVNKRQKRRSEKKRKEKKSAQKVRSLVLPFGIGEMRPKTSQPLSRQAGLVFFGL